MVAMPPRIAQEMPWFRTDGFGRGLAFAAIAAVVATIVWYAVVAVTSYQLGLVATLVGWVIGSAAVFGARGRGSMWLVAASFGLTLAALTISEYLILVHFAGQFGVEFALLRTPLEIIELVIASITIDPVTLVFWAFALGAAAWVPFKAIAPAEPAPDSSAMGDSPQPVGP